jgi:RNA polymerase sigma-70 factor (ECF subfamily)
MAPIMEPIWLEPFPDEWLVEAALNPETRYAAHESVSLAFLAALQLLPPRQRAVLVLCDVLDWSAREAAELLGLTVSAVNSALHRARVTLGKHYHARGPEAAPTRPGDEATRALLHKYVRAWEAADVDGLVALLKEEAVFTMPPSPSWYRGRAPIGAFVAATIFGDEGMFSGQAAGRWRLMPARANAQPAFAVYERDPSGGGYRAFALQVLTFDGDQLAEVANFIDAALFARFGLPAQLEA